MPCMLLHFQEYSLKSASKVNLFLDSAVSYKQAFLTSVLPMGNSSPKKKAR